MLKGFVSATSDIIHQAQFALDVKAKVLPIYEKVFDIEYPLPKLDTLVANDFDAGWVFAPGQKILILRLGSLTFLPPCLPKTNSAMENWGLIMGRRSVFLLDPKRADTVSRKRVAAVQSHEVAHMWWVSQAFYTRGLQNLAINRFGNITTMEWWNYLYL